MSEYPNDPPIVSYWVVGYLAMFVAAILGIFVYIFYLYPVLTIVVLSLLTWVPYLLGRPIKKALGWWFHD